VSPGTNQSQKSLFQGRYRDLRNRERGTKVRWWWSTILPIDIQNGVKNKRRFDREFRAESTKPIFPCLDVSSYRFINHITVIHVLHLHFSLLFCIYLKIFCIIHTECIQIFALMPSFLFFT
jgi:hypothetical protein